MQGRVGSCQTQGPAKDPNQSRCSGQVWWQGQPFSCAASSTSNVSDRCLALAAFWLPHAALMCASRALSSAVCRNCMPLFWQLRCLPASLTPPSVRDLQLTFTLKDGC